MATFSQMEIDFIDLAVARKTGRDRSAVIWRHGSVWVFLVWVWGMNRLWVLALAPYLSFLSRSHFGIEAQHLATSTLGQQPNSGSVWVGWLGQ